MDQLNFIVKKLNFKNKGHVRKRTQIIRAIKKYWEPEECPICYEPMKIKTIVITKCYHIFCDECIIRHHLNNDKCPICRTGVDYYDILAQISSIRYSDVNAKIVDEKKAIEENPVIDNVIQFRRTNERNILITWNILITSTTVCIYFVIILIGSLWIYLFLAVILTIILIENSIVYRLI